MQPLEPSGMALLRERREAAERVIRILLSKNVCPLCGARRDELGAFAHRGRCAVRDYDRARLTHEGALTYHSDPDTEAEGGDDDNE